MHILAGMARPHLEQVEHRLVVHWALVARLVTEERDGEEDMAGLGLQTLSAAHLLA